MRSFDKRPKGDCIDLAQVHPNRPNHYCSDDEGNAVRKLLVPIAFAAAGGLATLNVLGVAFGLGEGEVHFPLTDADASAMTADILSAQDHFDCEYAMSERREVITEAGLKDKSAWGCDENNRPVVHYTVVLDQASEDMWRISRDMSTPAGHVVTWTRDFQFGHSPGETHEVVLPVSTRMSAY